MFGTVKSLIPAVAVLAAFTSEASAGTVALGAPLGVQLGTRLGTVLPFAEGGLLGIAAAGVIGGVWLARRKR